MPPDVRLVFGGEIFRMLSGERIFLRPMEERDVADRVRWFNDPVVGRLLCIEGGPLSEVGTRQWLQRAALDECRKDFMICLRGDGRSIGCIGLRAINWRHSKSETYLAIGERDFWRQGFGKEAQLLLLHYCFEHIGLNRVYSYSLANNEPMIRVNLSLGFTLEGTIQDDIFDHGEFCDRVITGITKAQFREKHGTNCASHLQELPARDRVA